MILFVLEPNTSKTVLTIRTKVTIHKFTASFKELHTKKAVVGVYSRDTLHTSLGSYWARVDAVFSIPICERVMTVD